MRRRLISGPTGAITLDEARAHLRVDGGDDDALIDTLIAAATAEYELEAGRAFGGQTWEAIYDAFPAGNINLEFGPLQSVTSITYIDTEGEAQTLPADDYEVMEGMPDGVIVPLASWPATSVSSNAVVVRFVAGDGVPEDCKQAVKLLVGHWFENREAAVTGMGTAELPLAYRHLVGLRRRMFV